MSHPEIVEATLDGETVTAEVALGGEDVLLVTPTRTLVYRAEGLLSDESVEEYPHRAEQLSVSRGRRKSKVTLDYGLDGTESIGVPTKRLEAVVGHVLAGVIAAAGITDEGEEVVDSFRFSELTLVVTSERLVKHIGTPVWDEDYEEFHYDDVTDLAFEDGSVATSVVLTLGGRQERFKTPNEEARAVRESLTSAILGYHDVHSLDAFREQQAPEEEEAPADARDDVGDFGAGLDPLSADPAETDASGGAEGVTTGDTDAGATAEPAGVAEAAEAADAGDAVDTAALAEAVEEQPADVDERTAEGTATAGTGGSTPGDAGTENGRDTEGNAAGQESESFGESDFESAASLGQKELAAELAVIRETVEAQGQQLQRQNELIEQLIEELRRGR